MRKKWILISLTVVLVAAAITGGVALAWGGSGHGWGWGRGDHDERNAAVAAKVAEILGTEEDETADAIAQAQSEVRQEAYDASVANIAGRVAETLGTDADATAEAMKKVAQAMRSEALESKLQAAIDDGRLTEEQAQEYRDKATTQGWRGKSNALYGAGTEDFANRVGDELDVAGSDVSDAIDQALQDIRSEAIEARLQSAIDSGKITEDEAVEIREKIESGDRTVFGKHGRHGKHGVKGLWGRGHHGRHGHDTDGDDHSEDSDDSDGENHSDGDND